MSTFSVNNSYHFSPFFTIFFVILYHLNSCYSRSISDIALYIPISCFSMILSACKLRFLRKPLSFFEQLIFNFICFTNVEDFLQIRLSL